MSIHNITEYKKAIVIVKELEKAIKVLKATETSLRNYSKYKPIQNILTTLRSEEAFLQLYIEKYKIIRDTKGQTRP